MFRIIYRWLFRLQTQEVELKRMRDELNDLRQQEAALEEQTNSRQQQLNQLSKNLDTVMQEVAQVRRHLWLRGEATSMFCIATVAVLIHLLHFSVLLSQYNYIVRRHSGIFCNFSTW